MPGQRGCPGRFPQTTPTPPGVHGKIQINILRRECAMKMLNGGPEATLYF
jgi:hypothetical protein